MNYDNYRRARRRVKRKKGFYYHLATYAAFVLFFFLMNQLTDPWDQWWPYPALSWGLAVFFHYLFAVGLPFSKISSRWEERELEKEIDRIEGRESSSAPAPEIDEELELKDFKQLRKEWDDQEFV